MKGYLYYMTLGLGTLVTPAPLLAQTTAPRLANNGIVVSNRKVERTEQILVVGLRLNLDSLRLKARQRLVYTPMVKAGGETRTLPPIVVNGRREDVAFQRYAHKDYADDATVVRRKNGTAQAVDYSAVVPYEEWMKNADVVIAEDVCGCGNIDEQNLVTLRKFRTPVMAYLRPAAEAVKERSLDKTAYIDFPVDQTVLYPDYRRNPSELDSIVNTINVVKQDKNVTIRRIDIHGFASPESPYTHNDYLAGTRALTLKNYVRRLVALDESVFTVSHTAENWEGLRRHVAGSNLEHRDAILALIDADMDPDAKEWKIKSTYPEEYKFMLATWYPALRRSDYHINYVVRPFSVDEAKEILKTKPQQLSLEEMFMVAQTYEPGSADFNEVMDIAVRMYPANETANLNAACSNIEREDYAAAEKYLAKAGRSPYAAHARGVIAMKRGDLDEARRWFAQAKAGGVPEATRNLELLDGE